MRAFTFIILSAALSFTPIVNVMAADAAIPAPSVSKTFLAKHCLDCHSGTQAEAGLDLEKLKPDVLNPKHAKHWVRIYDRVEAGEMPPADYEPVPKNERAEFLEQVADWIQKTQLDDFSDRGRVRARRLTNLQLERSLHQLLGIDIPLEVHFPAEPRTNGYTTVADGQPMSHFQMEQHLTGVDRALDEAFRRVLSNDEGDYQNHLSAKELSRKNPRRRCREPEVIDGHGVVWSSALMFYGRIPATTARSDGWYRFTIEAKALNLPSDHGVWCSVRRGRCVSSAPLLAWVGALEATEKTNTWTFETWLPKGEMLEIRPGDRTLKMARFQGGQVGTGEGTPQKVPGIAIKSIDIEQIHRGPSDAEMREMLLGSLEVKPHRDWQQASLNSKAPKKEIATLVKQFANRAFRQPVNDDVVQPYVDFAIESLDSGLPLVDALRAGYRAVLCSPRFMYFQEQPGELDDYAIASRLSYFLWNSPPDAELLQLAASGKLRDKDVVRQQASRMLNDDQERRFVEDFADQWLDLSLIDFTEPDRRLYRTFDIVVQQSMLDETHAYLQTLVDKDASVIRLVDSDFTFLNSRLARFYGIDSIEGDAVQKVNLPANSPRGGLLGQGAILKVTANGTTTSPVIRGIWVSERILGQEIPEPPGGVPAVEPDIRGAKSIRDQLEKHKSNESCAACHRHIDPPGYALENFDPAGSWRDRYPGRGKKRLPIDPSFEMADGRPFKDVNEFRQRVLEVPERLAENLATHLLTYGTGAPIHFADRQVVDGIVKRSADNNYGFRTIIEEAVTSRVFLTK